MELEMTLAIKNANVHELAKLELLFGNKLRIRMFDEEKQSFRAEIFLRDSAADKNSFDDFIRTFILKTADIAEVKDQELIELQKKIYTYVDDLELSVRTANCLKNAGIKLIGQLITRKEPEMLKSQNFGRKSLGELKVILAEMGLQFGMKLENFPDPKILEEKGITL